MKHKPNHRRKPSSVFTGDVWKAYAPGQDAHLNGAWVSRDEHGNLCACVKTKRKLKAHAKLCGVTLVWPVETVREELLDE